MPVDRVGLWATGPCLIFVEAAPGAESLVAGKPQPVFFGAGEAAPQIIEARKYRNINSDFGSRGKIYLDISAHIVVTMTYWRESSLAWIQRAPSRGSLRGTDGAGDVGFALGVQNNAQTGTNTGLWLVFSRVAVQPLFDGHPPGYRFPCTCLSGQPAVLRRPGSGKNFVQISWEAVRARDQTTGNYVLYDHDVSLVENLPLT